MFKRILASKKLTIVQRLRVSFLISIAIPIAVTTLAFSLYIKSSNNFNYQTVSKLLTNSSVNLSGKTASVEMIADSVLGDSSIQNELSILKDQINPSETDGYSILKNRLDSYLHNDPTGDIDSIRLITNQYDVTQSSLYSTDLPESIRTDLLKRADQADGRIIWVTDFSPEKGIFLVRKIRRISHLKLDTLGYLIISISPTKLLDSTIDKSNFPQAFFAILNHDKTIVKSESFPSSLDEINLDSNDPFQIKKINRQRYFIAHTPIQALNWTFCCAIDYNVLYQNILLFRNVALGSMGFSILSAFLLLKLTTAPISASFISLIKKINAFGHGNDLTVPDLASHKNQYDDEIGLINKNFDKMTLRIQTLVKEKYEMELRAKDAQLKILENQINPHFLFNTLESIHWRSESLGDDIISNITASLGDLLRISLSSDNIHSSIAQELQLVSNYIRIQQYRYDDLTFQVNVPDEYMNVYIPKFTLQPLVENAIRYSLDDDSDQCHIAINITRQSENLEVLLQNSGSQFPDHLIPNLENGLQKSHGFGIGILNVKKHLELEYGDDFQIQTFNQDQLACVLIVIPMERKTEQC